MSKKLINQNTNHDLELLNSIESNFIFDKNPVKTKKGRMTELKEGDIP